MKTKIRAAIAAVFFALSAPAVAQVATGNEFATQTPSKYVLGAVQMCVAADNKAYPCGTNGTGSASGASTNVSFAVAPTVAASSHAAGSSVGGLQTIAFFRAASTFSGIVNNVKWIWRTGANVTAVTVYLFSANPTASTCTDAAAVSIAAADVLKIVAGSPFTLTPAVVGTGATFSTAFVQSPVSVKNGDGTPGVNLYACVAVNATVTPAANDSVLTIAGITD